MAIRFRRNRWSAHLPVGWQGRNDIECATFTAEPEIGAFQISAAFKASTVLDDDLRDFAAEYLDAGAITHPATAGDFTGFEITFGVGKAYWRQWYLRHGKQMLFVTYNCSYKDRGIEDKAIDTILHTLKAVEDQEE